MNTFLTNKTTGPLSPRVQEFLNQRKPPSWRERNSFLVSIPPEAGSRAGT
jgi:hypothetical protein